MPWRRSKGRYYTNFYYDDARGVRHRHRKLIREAQNMPDAVKAETKIMHDIFQGLYGKPVLKDKPLEDFVKDDYIPWAEGHKCFPQGERSTTKAWLKLSALKGKTVREVSQFDMEKAKLERLQAITKQKRKIAPRTVSKELAIWSAVFRQAMLWEFAKTNPMIGIEAPAWSVSPPRILEDEEEGKLMPELLNGQPWLFPFVVTAIGTGMRPIEVCELKRSKINFNSSTAWPTHTKSKNDPRIQKGIPLDPYVKEVLQAWCAGVKGDWVFPSTQHKGKHLSYATALQAFKDACERAGIPVLTLHKLRHTFGTRLGEGGARLEIISELMGHADTTTTKIYVHPSLQSKKEAVSLALVTNRSQGKVEKRARKAS